MPPRKYSRAPFKRRRRKMRMTRRRGQLTSNLTKSINVGPVAPRTLTRMRYVESIAGNGSTLDQVWNLNSTFDPNRTGTGHQPYGRDTYAVLYNRYRVYKVKAKFSCNSSDTGGSRIIVVPTNTATAFTNPTLAAEQPRAFVGNFNTGNPYTFSKTYNLASIVGQTSAQYKSDDRFQALATADPSEVIALHVLITDAVGGVVSNVFYTVEFTYFVEWFDPEPLSQS